MTAVNDVRAHAGVALTPARRRFALFALALGGFGIGSSEFVTMGLLPEIASGLLPEMMATRPTSGWRAPAGRSAPTPSGWSSVPRCCRCSRSG